MSLGESATPGAVQRVAVAIIRGDSRVVVASDENVMSRAVALEVVAATSPESIDPGAVAEIRAALLEERWADAVLGWMDATGEVLDAYPDEPVWTEQQLDAERVSFELRLAPIFRD